jgi:N utilization substance protein B
VRSDAFSRQGRRRRNRTASRVAAVQALFQSEQTHDDPEMVIDQFIRHRLGVAAVGEGYNDGRVPDADTSLFVQIVRDVVRQQVRIDATVAEALPSDWPLARIDPVLRALLRAGCAELVATGNTPAKVVINEYVDIAGAFFIGAESRLTNAVLDRLARIFRVAEF